MTSLKNAGWLLCAGTIIALVALSRDGSTTRAALDMFKPVSQTAAAP
ncbi:hypothetical protein sos41_12960 [Alphaproteobacteria bacterium SO-S41]|nr:hypothetical protein sos41_12960 [Alphaproteobacteria bacterium SO-S41]